MSDKQVQKWTSTAGPRQTKAVSKALSAFSWKAKSYREITDYSPEGVILTCLFGGKVADGYAETLQAIGDNHAWTITRDNCHAIIAELEAATAALEIPTVDKRTTPEERAELAKQMQEAEATRKVEAEQHAADYEKAVAELRTQYPWAVKTDDKDGMGRRYSTHARAAANLREELRRVFPGVRFSVRSKSFSMGDSVDVGWELGPTTAEVDAIAGKYQHGHFDGMDDMYHDDHSAYGEAVKAVLGRSKYVSSQRDIPDAAREIVGRALCELQHVEYQGTGTRHVYGDGDTSYLSDHVWRMFAECSLPAGATVTGAEHIPDDENENYRECYRVAFTAPETAPAIADQEQDNAPTVPSGCEIQKHRHTKHGFDMWLVVPVARLDSSAFDAARDACKDAGGWYSRKWGRTPGGFAFKSPEAAAAFAADVFSCEQVKSTTPAADPMGVDAAYEDACCAACGL